MENTAHNFRTEIEGFIEHMEEAELSPRTQSGYLADLRSFAAWFRDLNSEEPCAGCIAAVDLRAYKTHCLKQEQKAKTINRRFTSIRCFLRWAEEARIIRRGSVPRFPRRVPEEKDPPRWLERNQRHALVRAVERRGRPRDLALVLVFLHTGLRVSEVCALVWGDLVLGERSGSVLVRLGKGLRRRRVPLNAQTRMALKAIRPADFDPRLPVFLGQRGPLTVRGVQELLAAYARRAGLDGLAPHQLRHSFCKSLADSGVRLEVVAALAGHARIETTRRYAEPSRKDLEEAVERLSGDEPDLPTREAPTARAPEGLKRSEAAWLAQATDFEARYLREDPRASRRVKMAGAWADLLEALPYLLEDGFPIPPREVVDEVLLSGGHAGWRWRPVRLSPAGYETLVADLAARRRRAFVQVAAPSWVTGREEYRFWGCEVAWGWPAEAHRRLLRRWEAAQAAWSEARKWGTPSRCAELEDAFRQVDVEWRAFRGHLDLAGAR